MGTAVITGTDTDAGKTVLAAAVLAATRGRYWKPIQAGRPTDTDTVRRLTGLPDAHFLPEAHVLDAPLCPSVAARHQGAEIAIAELALPASRPSERGGPAARAGDDPPLAPPCRGGEVLVVEGAGGVLVPINARETMADLFAAWGAPVVLAARTRLGTINHTLLSLEALRARAVPVLGVVFTGPDAPETIAEIEAFGRAPVLGRLPRLDPLTPRSLAEAARSGLGPLLRALERA